MEEPTQSPLLSEIRTLVASSDKPIVMIAVPRWAALHLGRERAKELGTQLIQGHADSLRYTPGKKQNNGCCVMWLPIEGHPFGGVFILANVSYEAGLLIAWTDRHSLLWPREFVENIGPLIAWRTDQERWYNNPPVAERETALLTRAAVKLTRKTPLFVHPSPYLVEVINAHSQSPQEETPPPAV